MILFPVRSVVRTCHVSGLLSCADIVIFRMTHPLYEQYATSVVASHDVLFHVYYASTDVFGLFLPYE